MNLIENVLKIAGFRIVVNSSSESRCPNSDVQMRIVHTIRIGTTIPISLVHTLFIAGVNTRFLFHSGDMWQPFLWQKVFYLGEGESGKSEALTLRGTTE